VSVYPADRVDGTDPVVITDADGGLTIELSDGRWIEIGFGGWDDPENDPVSISVKGGREYVEWIVPD
jgi:hypothetical protein